MYDSITYPALRYPVILLGNSIVSLLGESFCNFFRELFDRKEEAGHID